MKTLATLLALSTAALAANTHSITLTWDPSTTTGVTYSVKRGTVAGGPYTTQVMGSTALSYVDSGLSPLAHFCYVVTATNPTTGLESSNSNEACATTPADPVAPAAPLNLKAVAK